MRSGVNVLDGGEFRDLLHFFAFWRWGDNEGLLDFSVVSLPGDFIIWLASPEAVFLEEIYVWVNWETLRR